MSLTIYHLLLQIFYKNIQYAKLVFMNATKNRFWLQLPDVIFPKITDAYE